MDYSKAIEFGAAQQLLQSQIKMINAEISEWISQKNNLLNQSVTNLKENITPSFQTNGDIICNLLREKNIEGYDGYINEWQELVSNRNAILKNISTLNDDILTWSIS